MFEPPPPAGAFPSFQSLFGETNPYLELLHLPSARPVFALVQDAVEASGDADAEIFALFGERNWRCHLVAAAALLATGANPGRVDALWGTLQAGSWVAPQLAATAWLLDESFETRARALILTSAWAKTTSALGHFYRQLPA